uniref:Uncharacterized protein n=1 Tax=Populus trichocarpa TaxID=3694 RepID=A0A2K2BD12_POPTR
MILAFTTLRCKGSIACCSSVRLQESNNKPMRAFQLFYSTVISTDLHFQKQQRKTESIIKLFPSHFYFL